MADEVVIHVKGVDDLLPRPLDAFRQCVALYGTVLITETRRLEANQRTAGQTAEITSTMIHDANRNIGKGYARPGRSRRTVILQIIAYIVTFVGGGFAGYAFKSPIATIVAAVCVLVGVLSLVFGGRE